jgi:hypothetical protein
MANLLAYGADEIILDLKSAGVRVFQRSDIEKHN